MPSGPFPSAFAALLLPMLFLAACGGGGTSETRDASDTGGIDEVADVDDVDGTGEDADVLDAAAETPASDLDGLSISRVGLARFVVFPVWEYTDFTGTNTVSGTEAMADRGDHTRVELAFTALNAPLDGEALARIAAMPSAPATGRCYLLGEAGERSIGALLESLGSPLYAGDVVTVSSAAGSWFELHGIDDELDGPEYRVAHTSGDFADAVVLSSGVEGSVEPGTTFDIPGDAYPAFTAVDVPPMARLSDLVEGGADVRWSAGADPEVPVVIDVTFRDYVEIAPEEGGADGASADEDLGVVTGDDIRTLVEAPAGMRCVTRDTGRFVYPEELRSTMERFAAAGRAVIERIAPGSDLEDEAESDVDGGLTDVDEISVDQGTRIGVSRVATRYRVEGDALLIVQSTNGGTL